MIFNEGGNKKKDVFFQTRQGFLLLSLNCKFCMSQHTEDQQTSMQSHRSARVVNRTFQIPTYLFP